MDAASAPVMPAREASELFGRIAGNIEKVMRGSRAGVRKLLAAFASGGHVLIEDFPGTGKTTLAKSLAASIGAKFTRVQFTPDLLPSDILGVSVFNQREQNFEFRAG
ncbi:MAG TPA: AAA family ATPase, partial [Burkholderiaceae bacterium]